jgi:hypothetical protein
MKKLLAPTYTAYWSELPYYRFVQLLLRLTEHPTWDGIVFDSASEKNLQAEKKIEVFS